MANCVTLKGGSARSWASKIWPSRGSLIRHRARRYPGGIGTIVALQNADGSPPYVVHYLAGDYDSLIEPVPTARIGGRHTSRPSSRS
jgi:hypothetical protein